MSRRGSLERVEGPNGILIGYRLPVPVNEPDMSHARLAEIAARHPGSVICLLSALRLHGYTDDISGDDTAAVGPSGNRHTAVPSLRLVQWRKPLMMQLGVAEHVLAGATVRATDPARTVADLFRRVHAFGTDEKESAVVHLARSEGEDGLNRAGSYALTLGWYADIAPSLGTAKEMLRWHATPRP